jgi:hypothetical protein
MIKTRKLTQNIYSSLLIYFMMPRKLPPHIVLPNGQWRFVKRGSRRVGTSKRRSVSMARYRRRGRRSIRRVYSRHRRSGGGGMRIPMKGIVAPIVGGAADAIINPRSPINGIGSTAVGFLMKNETVKTIGLYQVGQSLATFIPFVGASAGGVASQV